MLNLRLNAARKVAEALTPAETDIEAAIASTSHLIAAIAEGRAKSKLPVTIGQDSLSRLSGAVAALIEARRGVVEAHAALAEDRINAGLRAYGMGDVSDCPSTAGLTLVEEARIAS